MERTIFRVKEIQVTNHNINSFNIQIMVIKKKESDKVSLRKKFNNLINKREAFLETK